MTDLFSDDEKRFDQFSLRFNEILVDYSKNLITEETLGHLLCLAREMGLSEAISDLFSGKKINATENRAVLHTALRDRSGESIRVDGHDVMPGIREELEKMERFAGRIRSGEWKGFSGKPIRDIVNIGIGGSDLGPAMVVEALNPYGHPRLRVHFVSNADGAQIAETLKGLDPETTLFIVASKSFTTQETLLNAHTARKWLLAAGGDERSITRHFVAVSANIEKVCQFGIDPENMFRIWDFVGGRFSLWSAVGLSIVCYIGFDHFMELLDGAYAMDRHFRHTPLEENIPVVLALIGVWYNNFFQAETEAILPYDQSLHRFPAYLQQAVMESNGKFVDKHGQRVAYPTSPIVWGEPGTNGQHAFFQLLHQGTRMVPATFLAAAEPHHGLGYHHEVLLAHFFAQTKALMTGRLDVEVRERLQRQGLAPEEAESLLPFRVFEGNRPSISILYKKLTPEVLGSLIALFEHKLFVQGIIWNIHSFDQWGVELGKELAGEILPQLNSDSTPVGHDGSTEGLIRAYKEMRATEGGGRGTPKFNHHEEASC